MVEWEPGKVDIKMPIEDWAKYFDTLRSSNRFIIVPYSKQTDVPMDELTPDMVKYIVDCQPHYKAIRTIDVRNLLTGMRYRVCNLLWTLTTDTWRATLLIILYAYRAPSGLLPMTLKSKAGLLYIYRYMYTCNGIVLDIQGFIVPIYTP